MNANVSTLFGSKVVARLALLLDERATRATSKGRRPAAMAAVAADDGAVEAMPGSFGFRRKAYISRRTAGVKRTCCSCRDANSAGVFLPSKSAVTPETTIACGAAGSGAKEKGAGVRACACACVPGVVASAVWFDERVLCEKGFAGEDGVFEKGFEEVRAAAGAAATDAHDVNVDGMELVGGAAAPNAKAEPQAGTWLWAAAAPKTRGLVGASLAAKKCDDPVFPNGFDAVPNGFPNVALDCPKPVLD